MFPELSRLRICDELQGRTFLVCVGAMRSATSWLYHYLGGFSEVAASPLKEVHFFNYKFAGNALGDINGLAVKRLAYLAGRDGDATENVLSDATFRASVDRVQMIYDDDAYFAHFVRLCTPRTRTFCDITPAYAVIGPRGFQYMRAFFATQGVRLKLLFVMRDPVARLWSQLVHMQALNPAGAVATKWAEAIQSPQVFMRADYRGTVEDLDKTFPSEDVQYQFFEELFTEDSLRRLCAFADIEYRPGEMDVAQNTSQAPLPLPNEARDAFHRVLAPQYAFCRARFGDRVPSGWAA